MFFSRLAAKFVFIFSVFILLCSGPAFAQQNKVLSMITKEQLLKVMQEGGYSVVLNERKNLSWQIDGKRAVIFVNDGGKSLQFYAGFTGIVDLQVLNEWNKSKRYSRSYLDSAGDPSLELDLDLDGGVTVARIYDFLKTCEISFNLWRKHIAQQ